MPGIRLFGEQIGFAGDRLASVENRRRLVTAPRFGERVGMIRFTTRERTDRKPGSVKGQRFEAVMAGSPGGADLGRAAPPVRDPADRVRLVGHVWGRRHSPHDLGVGMPGPHPELLIDAIFGAIYYRMLLRHAPLTEQYGDALIDKVLRGLRCAGTSPA